MSDTPLLPPEAGARVRAMNSGVPGGYSEKTRPYMATSFRRRSSRHVRAPAGSSLAASAANSARVSGVSATHCSFGTDGLPRAACGALTGTMQ